MKPNLFVFCAAGLLLSLNAHATRETGGTPRPPRAVVLQGHLVNGIFDGEGWKKALKFAAQELRQRNAVLVTNPPELQYPDRSYLCVEYRSYDDFIIATAKFKQLLIQNTAIEVVQNGSCPRQ